MTHPTRAAGGIVELVLGVGLSVRDRLRGGRVADVMVAAELEAALLASAAALRHLGARITRYDADAGTLEAALAGGRVRVQVVAVDDATALVRLRGDGAGRRLVRQFRTALSRPAEGER